MKFDELGLLGLIVNMGLRSFIHRLTAPAYSTGEGPAGRRQGQEAGGGDEE